MLLALAVFMIYLGVQPGILAGEIEAALRHGPLVAVAGPLSRQ